MRSARWLAYRTSTGAADPRPREVDAFTPTPMVVNA